MFSPLTWLIGGAVVLSIAAAASLPGQLLQQPPPRQDSFSISTGPASESVIASWHAHGAGDGPIAATPAVPLVMPPQAYSTGGPNIAIVPPNGERISPLEQDWMLDFLVMWRWRGRAPEMVGSGGGGDVYPGGPVVHGVAVAGGRQLRVVFDPRARSVTIQDGTPLSLGDANVLMLDVDPQTVRVISMATVPPRYARPTDPVESAIAESAEVAAFVGRHLLR